jgi:hypothetical protein
MATASEISLLHFTVGLVHAPRCDEARSFLRLVELKQHVTGAKNRIMMEFQSSCAHVRANPGSGQVVVVAWLHVYCCFGVPSQLMSFLILAINR